MQTYPKLRGSRIAPVDALEFRARDGVVLHGYLTTPLDIQGKPQTGAPLLVISHDGPTGEVSTYEYEYERQLFASRDYAVLQINHRGSSGRGRAFERLGDGQWGRAVQDDFADAARWAIDDGVAAAGRVCFVGTGYGAFSAMIAAAREPELFKCVVGVAGIYDMPRMYEHDLRDVPAYLQQAMGSDMAELLAISPVANAKPIKAGVLLLAQQNDEHGPYEQSTRMRAALKAAGVPTQWDVIGREEQGYHSPQNRAKVYTRILRYLDQQIGTKAD
jgi:dipeptidyl aminopeptidase/acylaminoacyl peptidase